MILNIYFTLLLMFSYTVLSAQTIEKFSIDNGGASTIVGGLEILYTIGEVNVQEVTNANFNISEGFINTIGSGTLSISIIENSDFIVYPNPTVRFLNISSSTEIKKIEIYNLLGDLVLEVNNKNTLDMGNIESAMYLLKIYSDKSYLVKKIIKL